MEGRSSPSRWLAGCIIATHDAQPEQEFGSHMASNVRCAHCMAEGGCRAQLVHLHSSAHVKVRVLSALSPLPIIAMKHLAADNVLTRAASR
jgi:hypothetical protein